MNAVLILLWRTCLLATLIALVGGTESGGAVITDEECLNCHSQPDLRSGSGKNLFIDRVKFAKSAHCGIGLNCISCHDGIRQILEGRRVPHALGIEPKCSECHIDETRRYSRSLHAQISKKICYSCHNPHYSVSFRQLTMEDRKGMCLKCHEAYKTHNWLPQKQLHFNYLECASCHDMNAEIGAVFYIIEKGKPSGENILHYDRMARIVKPGQGGLVGMMDQDGDGKLSPSEIDSFVKRLRDNGIPDAALDVRILVMRPAHNFTDKGDQTRDCSLCHSESARFYSKLVLEVPEKDGDARTVPVDRQILAQQGSRSLSGDFYLLGESKIRKKDLEDLWDMVKQIGFKWIDFLGVLIVSLSVLVVSLHAVLMLVTRKLRGKSVIETRDHPIAESAWHLIHGLCVMVLLLTGLQMRLPDLLPIFATFLNAVNLHNICGAVVLLDYVFWLVYQIRTGGLMSNFLSLPRGFFRNSIEMLHYYGYLVFIHEDYPRNFDSRAVLEQVEKALFFVMMFLLIPAQILTGILLFDLYKTMPIVEKLGGVRLVDAVHLTVAYLLMSFLIVHTYFHTLKKFR